MKPRDKAPTANFMILAVACTAVLPYPMGSYLNLLSSRPSHGHELRNVA